MADNVQLPVTGTGTPDVVVASDDVAGVQYPIVKLADGTLGSTALLPGNATTGLKVDLGTDNDVTVTGAVAVTNTGTFATQVDGNALTALQLLDDTIKQDDAAFTVGTDKVSMMGGVAVAHGASPDAADAGDAVAPLMNRHRVQFVIGGHPNAQVAVYNTTAAQTDDNILPAISAGTKYAVTRIDVTVDESVTVGVGVRIGFGTANVPALGASAADAVAGILLYHPGLIPGGGMTIGNGGGILGVGGDGEELRITNDVPTGGTLGITVSYFTIDS